jgi:hypothetical protein
LARQDGLNSRPRKIRAASLFLQFHRRPRVYSIMIEPRYILAICVLAFWIVVRLFLMHRRKVLMQRRRERELFNAQEPVQDSVRDGDPPIDGI